jgi:hypothetical protein
MEKVMQENARPFLAAAAIVLGTSMYVPAWAANPTSANLVAHWQLDEASGLVAHDVTGQHDGQLSSAGATFEANGIAGNALRLNRALNGMVMVSHLPELVTNDFTVAAWAKLPPGDTTPLTVLWAQHEAWNADGCFAFLNVAANMGAVGRASVVVNDGYHVATGTSSIHDGQWHQIVVAYAKSGQTLIYVDGSPAEASMGSVGIIDRGAPFMIGGLFGNEVTGVPNGYFTGWIDDVQVYSQVLTSTEIDSLFANPGQNLLGLYSPPVIISPNGGSFTNSIEVVLTATVPGTSIRYTLDGSEPVVASLVYSEPIMLTNTATLSARLFVGDLPASAIVSALFTKTVPVPPPTALVAHWRLDESSGAVAHDVTGQHDGQLSAAGATFEASGIAGNALRLNRSLNGMVMVSHLPELVTNDFTVAAWAKLPVGDTTSLTVLWAQHEAWNADGCFAFLNVLSGLGIAGKASVLLNDGYHVATGTSAINDGQWHQIAATYAKSGRTILYVDGTPAEATMNSVPIIDRGAPFMIGGLFGNEVTGLPNGYFTGWIDDVQVYSRALTETELDTLFTNPGINLMELAHQAIWAVPGPGSYDHSVELRLLTSLADGIIHFTLDGGEPTLEAAAFTTPVRLSTNVTVKARAFVGTNSASEVFTAAYQITLTPPAITTALASNSVVLGKAFTFAASAIGSSPLFYQWSFQGASLPDQTNQTLSLSHVTEAQAGVYSVTVSNEVGAVTKAVLNLAVILPPTIVVQPQSISVVAGQVATFAVVATGTEPLTYSWYRSGGVLVGSGSPTLTLSNVTQTAGYYVKVSNTAGYKTSSTATLTVVPAPVAPTIVTAPQSQIVNADADVTFTVSVSGTSPFAYQWYRNGQLISGAAAATLLLPGVKVTDAGTYVVRVSNDGGAATSGGAVLDVDSGVAGGLVNFDNHLPGFGIDAPVFDSDGTNRLSGPAFLAQLYAGLTIETLAAVGPAVPFRTGSGAGYVVRDSTVRTIPSVTPGGEAQVQMRVWESARGATFEEAFAAGGRTGKSDVLRIMTGGGIPPMPPASMVGLASFIVRAETVPPVITITSPAPGTTGDERVALVGTVTDNAGVASARWERDGQTIGNLPLSGGSFAVTGLLLHRGENRFRVVAQDVSGNEAAADVVTVWVPLRTLTFQEVAPVQEGLRVVLPLKLASSGEVGGLLFVLQYDTEQFQDPQFAWGPMQGGLSQVNYANGQIRATLSLSGGGIPEAVGELSLRVRSVPMAVNAAVALELLSASDQAGNRFVYGTDVVPGLVTVLPRRIKGDNNGNDRLDVGDATIIQQFLVGLQLPREWDVAANDLNQVHPQPPALDPGDVTKVLRAVVGLDPQPELPPIGLSVANVRRDFTERPRVVAWAARGSGGEVLLAADRLRARAGDSVHVQVCLANVTMKIAGVSFRLNYPAGCLRLVDSASVQVGPIVPADAMAAWNVSPSWATPTGQVTCAIVSATAWQNATGVVASLTFVVEPSYDGQAEWPVELAGVELTSDDGYDLYNLAGATLIVNPRPRFTANPVLAGGTGRLTYLGVAGSEYGLEASSDLLTWVPVANGTNSTGTATVVDLTAGGTDVRFYRVKEW